MSDHLPECVIPTPELGVWVCICNRLRACEGRVSAPLLALVAAGGEGYAQGYEWGRGEALDAARSEAAIAMCAIDTYLPPEEHNAVLAAIDALKEKQ